MIPKIIHQTYKDYNLPNVYQKCQQKIKELHPDFEYRFYTDDDMKHIMKSEFPDYYELFYKLPRKIMQIDMFRYFLMFKYGGLYVDLDYLMLHKFDILDYPAVIPCSREDENGNIKRLGNCIFASRPNHPFWKHLIDTLFTFERHNRDYRNDIEVDDGPYGTGPEFVFRMWQQFPDNIYVPTKKYFHPITNQNIDYINNLIKEKVYGMHLCTGIWRNNNL